MLSFVSPTKSWSDLSEEIHEQVKKSDYAAFYAVASYKSLVCA